MPDTPSSRFAELVARPEGDIPLDEAALLIAATAQPGLDVDAQLTRLDDLAAGCPQPTVSGLRRHLFDDLGFTGNRDEYGDPRNSFLDQVLERRRGIPISLSVVTVEVARRLGVPLVGVGMPGHFLVGVVDEPGTYLDPFGGGRTLDASGCEALFRQLGGTGPFFPGYLAPAGPLAILARMLANLQNLFVPRDLAAAAWVLELRLALPGSREQRRDLARALGGLGRFMAGAAALDRVADLFPEEEADALHAEAIALRARSN